MFSHLCRACLREFENSSEVVPLFEPRKKIWYHRLINTTFRLSLTKDDNLSTNVCKSCALEILRSYKFRLKYIESERKLREFLEQSKEEPNLLEVEITVGEGKDIAQADSSLTSAKQSKWKCDLCSARFANCIQYRNHRRLHHFHVGSDAGSIPTKSPDKQNCWKCVHCSAEFRTKKLKLNHEREQHADFASLHKRRTTIQIHDDDSNDENFILPNLVEVNVEPNPDELKFLQPEPDMDLGLFVIERSCQIDGFDPLGVNNADDTLLVPIHHKQMSALPDVGYLEYINDINSKWKCTFCPEAFRTRDQLREHNRAHMTLKKTRAKEMKMEKLKKRKLEIGKDRDKEWTCQTCWTAFGTEDLLREHRRTYLAKNEATGCEEQLCGIVKVEEPI